MTYGQLLTKLSKLNETHLRMDVTIRVNDEFYPADTLTALETDGILDEDHPVITIVE